MESKEGMGYDEEKAYKYYLKHFRYALLPHPNQIGSPGFVPQSIRYPGARLYPEPVPVDLRNQTKIRWSFKGIRCEDDEPPVLKRPRKDDLGQPSADNSNPDAVAPSPTSPPPTTTAAAAASGNKPQAVAETPDGVSTLKCPCKDDLDQSSVDNPEPADSSPTYDAAAGTNTIAEVVAQMQDRGSTLECPRKEDLDQSSVDNPKPADSSPTSAAAGSI